jgi:hypothetical protein
MIGAENVSASWGIAFLVGAGAMAEFTAKACSSPQTVEINADKRSGTLMKWVNVGLIEGAAIIAVAVAVDKKNRNPIFYGALMEAIITFAEYVYAKRSGLASPGEGTETY